MKFEIIRQFENDDLIIYKRLFDLTNCCGDKRYFVAYKEWTGRASNLQFRSITQVKRFIKSLN